MKKLLFAFLVLTVVMGNTSLFAQHCSLIDDDEREIPLNPAGPKEGGPVARSIIIQPASAYINNDVVTVVFNNDVPEASISITNAITGANVYSESYANPTLTGIDLSAKEPGEYYLEIVLGEFRLSGYFTL